jgi:6-phosphogluconolactonase
MDHEVFEPAKYAAAVAERFARASHAAPRSLVLTGGTTAEKVYEALAERAIDLSGIEVFFSDERCVPPNDERSNYLMAKRTFLDRARAANVHRMRGEDTPDEAASAYDREITPFEDVGFDLVLLGMGADCHIGAIYPHSPALAHPDLCSAVDRPDGMKGLTLTARSITTGKETWVLVTGEAKAEAVRRVLRGDEEPESCPARLLADRTGVTFLLDEAAASLL